LKVAFTLAYGSCKTSVTVVIVVLVASPELSLGHFMSGYVMLG